MLHSAPPKLPVYIFVFLVLLLFIGTSRDTHKMTLAVPSSWLMVSKILIQRLHIHPYSVADGLIWHV